GVFGSRTIANHCVHLTERDMGILKARGVGISHNPESNMKLASGAAPVARLLTLGIAVGLGTDGAASNNDLDMFEAMDFASKLQKLATGNPAVLPAEQVVAMATLGGARALGLDREIGSIGTGKRADLILVDAGAPHAVPLYNVYSHIVYALKGSDVVTSIVNGRVVMLDRRILTLNETDVSKKAQEFQRRVAAGVARGKPCDDSVGSCWSFSTVAESAQCPTRPIGGTAGATRSATCSRAASRASRTCSGSGSPISARYRTCPLSRAPRARSARRRFAATARTRPWVT